MTYRCHSASCTPKRSTRLSPVNKGPNPNSWCGPAAISIITGHTTGCAAAMLRHWSRRRAIMGVYHDEMIEALLAFGWCCWGRDPYPRSERPTLARFLRERKGRTKRDLILLSVGHHYIVVKGRKYCDNLWSNGEPQWIRQCPHRRTRVNRWWTIHSFKDCNLNFR